MNERYATERRKRLPMYVTTERANILVFRIFGLKKKANIFLRVYYIYYYTVTHPPFFDMYLFMVEED